MDIPFLITGLPRSRTAWMSIVASMGPASICFHEPMLALGSWREAKKLWADDAYKFVGISDSGAGFHLAEIMRDIRPRTLIIERLRADVDVSLRILSDVQTNYCDLLSARLEEFKSHPLVKVVAFADLTDTSTVMECLDWLMPSLTFDRRKIDQMQAMNIAVDMDRVWRLAHEHKHNLAELIGPDAGALRQMPGVQ